MSILDVDDALGKFMETHRCDGIFLMGTKDGQDFGIITNSDDELNDKIVQILRTRMRQDIREIWNVKSHKFGGRFFDHVTGVSRKVIMPLVQEAVNTAIAE